MLSHVNTLVILSNDFVETIMYPHFVELERGYGKNALLFQVRTSCSIIKHCQDIEINFLKGE